jgi:hypothetical protein
MSNGENVKGVIVNFHNLDLNRLIEEKLKEIKYKLWGITAKS